ncbi:MAG TPA: ice-binding family protein [Syntrophomonadaceae bacterium]|nr:ice-binding family protein [Syntrophomonadaceae bacterium]
MKSLNKIRFIPLLLTLLLVVIMAVSTMPAISMASQPAVSLGTTSNFAVLAGSTITNTGPTTINGDAGGDVGLFPGTDFPGQASVSVSGSVYLADTIASVAQDDLITAYNDADGRTPVTRIPTELGGTTLIPGIYDSADGTFQITGTLTLDAQGDPNGVFVFKTASTLITASSSNVNLINSARYCRTFWKVGSSATLGTNSHFAGHILALTSITANNGATVQGQLLARNGAVTLDTNTITNGLCATANPTVELESIAITHPAAKLVYTVGENLDIFGLEVTGTYSDKSQKVVSATTVNVSGFNSSTAAVSQPLTITFGGKTTSFTVEIKQAGTPTGEDGGGESFPIFSAAPSYFEQF